MTTDSTRFGGCVNSFGGTLAKMAVFAVLLLGTSRLDAQSYVMNAGSPSFSTNLPVENGSINVSNGNLHLEIPLGSYPQRGGRADKIALVYDSPIWFPDPSAGPPSAWEPTNINSGNPPFGEGGWRLVSSGDSGTMDFGYTVFWCNTLGSFVTINGGWNWTAPDGTQHSFPVETGHYTSGSCATDNSTASGYASDGSGFYISITSDTNATVYAPDGTSMEFTGFYSSSALLKQDANQNQYTTDWSSYPTDTYLYDTFQNTSRPVVDIKQTSDGWEYDVPKFGGGTNAYVLHFGSQPVYFNTNFNDGVNAENSGSFQAPAELDLPDGTKYTFQYDTGTSLSDPTYHYGLLTQMILPTGATINYGYTNFPDATGNVYRWVTSRQTPDSSTGWSYTPSIVNSCSAGQVNCQQTVTVVKPSNDKVVYTFDLNGGSWPIEVQYEDSSSTVLASTTACYNFVTVSSGACTYGSPGSGSPATSVYKLAETTTLGSVSKTTEYAWDSSNNGNLITKSEWNFGHSPASVGADRTTSISYYSNGYVINRPYIVQVNGGAVAKTVYHYDESGSVASACTSSGCGNLTTVSRFVDSSTYLDTHFHYTGYGMVSSMTDPRGKTITYTPDSTGAYSNEIQYPTTGSVTHIEYPTYDSSTGLLSSLTDQNGNVFSYSYDSMGRLTTAINPDNGWNLTHYNSTDTQADLYTAVTSTSPSTSCTGCRHDQTVFDGLGRVSNQIHVSDPAGSDTIATVYDVNGRVQKVSNPYRSTSDPTFGWTTPTYDSLDRPTQVQEPDGSYPYTYYGAAVTTGLGGLTSQSCSTSTYGTGYPILKVDEAGNKRESWIDGFGRTIEVDEPNTGGALSPYTCYKYDLNDNLTDVAAAASSQIRGFSYDLISRLTSASNPEASSSTATCPVSYTYDNNGNLHTKVGPEQNQGSCSTTVTTTYGYDDLNRLTSKSYSDGITPSATYTYDTVSISGVASPTNAVGQMVEASTSNTASVFSYDPMGRKVWRVQCTPSLCGSGFIAFYYSYDLLGNLTSASNGFGYTTSYNYDNNGQFYSMTSNWSDTNHPGGLAYVNDWWTTGRFPDGTTASLLLWNNVTETSWLNKQFQPCRINFNTSTTTLSSCTGSAPSNNVLDMQYGRNEGSADNGDVVSFAATGAQSFSRTYTYDPLNRISTMSAPGDTCSGLSFSYDALGNRTAQTPTSGTCGAGGASYDSRNHITNTGFTYDAAGNETSDSYSNFYYDAENRLIQVDGTFGTCSTATACYAYDALGERVAKSGTNPAEYEYNQDGQVDSVTNGAGTRSYVYLNGRQLIEYTSSTTHFLHRDHLGSTRLVTDYPTPNAVECNDYYPFGEFNSCSSGSASLFEFAGQERDTETNFDHLPARYYYSGFGRFKTPDPGNAGANPANPQSWNGYSYALNNPLAYTDPSGMDACGADGATEDDPFCSIDITLGIGWGGNSNISGPESVPPENAGTHSPGGAGDPDPNGPFSGTTWPDESFGIPNGMQLPGGNLAGILLPSDPCSYGSGSCGGMIYGFQGPAIPWEVEGAESAIGWLARLLWPVMLAKQSKPKAESGAQDKKLTSGEIQKLKEKGYDPEKIKDEMFPGRGGQADLYKTPNGDIVVKGKGGVGPGEPTGININKL